MIFAGAEMMGWHTPPKTSMEHMGFGLVLGPDGKKFKTRSGETVKLNSLLDEAKDRALN
jgi:arginyl-tRNA synthetase